MSCTEAALYYHFKDGKRELLKTVIEVQIPEMQDVIDQCCEATSLKDVFLRFNAGISERSSTMRWVLTALPHLNADEREHVLKRFSTLTDGLVIAFKPYVVDEKLASHLAWLVVCVSIGYAQLFCDPTFNAQVDLSPHELMQTLVEVIT